MHGAATGIKGSRITKSRTAGYGLVLVVLTGVGLLAVGTTAAGARDKRDLVCKDAKGVAAGGYDVVAYFTDQKAVKGSEAFSAKHGGAEYHFASAEHRDRFAANPQAYLPQYGGHCAYAMGKNKMMTGDPEAWLVYKGKLYLTVSREVLALFQTDVVTAINQADAIWKSLN